MAKDPKITNPRTVNGVLADRHVRHGVYLEGLKTHESKEILRLLDKDVFPDLVDKIASRLNRIHVRGADVSATQFKSVKELMQTVDGVVRARSDVVLEHLRGSLQAIAEAEAGWAVNAVTNAMPIAIDMSKPSMPLLKSIINNRPMNGHLLKDWWGALKHNTAVRVDRQIQIGLVQGESVDQMVRRLVGTRANNYTDGVLQATRREAETVVRTSVQHVSAQARAETYKENADILDGEVWQATLDHRTCEICGALDGKRFALGEGIHPPAHPSCRCNRSPIVKSFRELGIDLNDPPDTTRAAKQYDSLGAALRGEVPAATTFGSWLRDQPKDVQENVLGVGKAAMFRAGKVDIQQFTDARMRPLTLAEVGRLDR